MPKISDEPLLRMQVRIFKRDKNRLDNLFKDNIGLNEGIRKIIRLFLNQSEEKIRQIIDSIDLEDL
jgi:hypothetical protein